LHRETNHCFSLKISVRNTNRNVIIVFRVKVGKQNNHEELNPTTYNSHPKKVLNVFVLRLETPMV